jgi:hypothetical protein
VLKIATKQAPVTEMPQILRAFISFFMSNSRSHGELCRNIIASQQAEINQMTALLQD